MSLPDGTYNKELGEDVNVDASDISKRMIHLNTVLEHFLETMGERVSPGTPSGASSRQTTTEGESL